MIYHFFFGNPDGSRVYIYGTESYSQVGCLLERHNTADSGRSSVKEMSNIFSIYFDAGSDNGQVHWRNITNNFLKLILINQVPS